MNIRRCLDILELENVTSPEELKQAYRDVVQIWQPDRFQGKVKLEKKYKLIKVDFEYAENAYVTLLDKYPKKDLLLLPSEYFKYGWNNKLSFRAKYC